MNTQATFIFTPHINVRPLDANLFRVKVQLVKHRLSVRNEILRYGKKDGKPSVNAPHFPDGIAIP